MSESVASAIAACSKASSKESGIRAYDALLWAVGNNHAGTYDWSALDLIDAIRPLLSSFGPWSQRAALEAMIDLYGSFESEVGEQLTAELRQRIASLEPHILVISKSSTAASSSACDLLELLNEPAA